MLRLKKSSEIWTPSALKFLPANFTLNFTTGIHRSPNLSSNSSIKSWSTSPRFSGDKNLHLNRLANISINAPQTSQGFMRFCPKNTQKLLKIRETAPNSSTMRQHFFNFLNLMRQKVSHYFGHVSKSAPKPLGNSFKMKFLTNPNKLLKTLLPLIPITTFDIAQIITSNRNQNP